MDQKMHLICESIQEVTLAAWPIVWDDNKYDQDSRVVLEMLRDWGEAFEDWWISHDEDWICEHDYIEYVWRYADIKSRQYVRSLRSVEDIFLERERNIQEFTAIAVDSLYYDKIYGVLTGELLMTREQAFDKIRELSEKYWTEYDDDKDALKQLEDDPVGDGQEEISAYLIRKVAELKAKK